MFYLCLFQREEEKWGTVTIDFAEAVLKGVSEPN